MIRRDSKSKKKRKKEKEEGFMGNIGGTKGVRTNLKSKERRKEI